MSIPPNVDLTRAAAHPSQQEPGKPVRLTAASVAALVASMAGACTLILKGIDPFTMVAVLRSFSGWF